MNKEQLKILSDSIGVRDDVFEVWYPYFTKYLSSNGIDTPKRILAFLAQTGQESGGFYWTEEIDKTTCQRYEGGCTFLGRGLIGLTHKSNYEKFKKRYGVDVVSNPSLVGGKNALVSTPAQLKNSLFSATYFWEREKLNDLADKLDLSKPVYEEPNNTAYRCIGREINRGSCGAAAANGENVRLQNFEKLRIAYNENKGKFRTMGKGRALVPIAISIGVVGVVILSIYLYKRYKKK